MDVTKPPANHSHETEPGTPHEEVPGFSLVERQPARRGSTRRSFKATAPRTETERRTYIRLKCGHYTDSASVAFFSVWQPREDEGEPELHCETCHKWVSVIVTPIAETGELPNF